LEVAHPNATGFDIASASHFAAVRPDADDTPVREFGSFIEDLEALAQWLTQCDVDVVVMESTGCIGSRCMNCSNRGAPQCIWSMRATSRTSRDANLMCSTANG
jgi:hypothetical protein